MKSNNFTVANKRLTGSSYVPGKQLYQTGFIASSSIRRYVSSECSTKVVIAPCVLLVKREDIRLGEIDAAMLVHVLRHG